MSDLWIGHIPATFLTGQPEGLDVLLRRWDDGGLELAVRPGHERRGVTWSPPVALAAEAAS